MDEEDARTFGAGEGEKPDRPLDVGAQRVDVHRAGDADRADGIVAQEPEGWVAADQGEVDQIAGLKRVAVDDAVA